MTTLSESVALNETALVALKSENESLRTKLAVSNSEVDRLTADQSLMMAKLDNYIRQTAKMQTLIDSAGVLLIEGRKVGQDLQPPVIEAPADLETTKRTKRLSEGAQHV